MNGNGVAVGFSVRVAFAIPPTVACPERRCHCAAKLHSSKEEVDDAVK